MKTKIHIGFAFYFTCPECGGYNKLEPLMQGDGDKLYAHFLKVYQDQPRDGLPEIACEECSASFTPWSFVLPGTID